MIEQLQKNKFDRWSSIAVAIFMALVGYAVMVAVPVLSTALVQKAGFTAEQVGRIWGADLGGLALGAVISAFLVAKVNRWYLVWLGVLLSITANLLCMEYSSYQALLLLRTIAGVGSGIFTAVAVVTLGGTSKPVIAFNLELVGFAFSTALELHYLPQFSMNQIYLFFISLSALCAFLVFFIPDKPSNEEELAAQEELADNTVNWQVPRALPLICLLAICFTYINIGGYFTYVELAALEDGVAEDWVGSVLTWSSFLGIAGCAIAFYATRFGLFRPLILSLAALVGIVVMLSAGVNDANIVISLFGFMTIWTFADVYQSSILAHMDRSGSLVALIPSVQGFGQFIGPNIAASIVGAGLGYGLMFAVSAGMAAVALALYIGIAAYIRKH